MKTRIVSVKDWRQNLTKLWKEAKGTDIRFIVMNHSKPMYEVKPVFDEKLEIDDIETKDTYGVVEKSLDFWKGDEDDDIFDESISL